MKWIKHTFLIFIIAQLGHFIINVIYRIITGDNGDFESYNIFSLCKDILTPKYALWYLLCLLYWRIIIWNFPKKINDVSLFIGSFILSVVVGAIPIGQTLAFQRIFSFFPFFVLGLIFKKHSFMNKIESINIFIPMVVIFLGLLISRELPLFQPRDEYNNLNDAILRMVQSVIGLLLCISIIRVSRATTLIEKVSKYGAYTLWIYIGHTFLVTIIDRKLLPNLGLTYNVFFALMIATLYCVIFIVMARFYYKKKVTPVTSITE